MQVADKVQFWLKCLRETPKPQRQVHTYLGKYSSGPNKDVHTPIYSQKNNPGVFSPNKI